MFSTALTKDKGRRLLGDWLRPGRRAALAAAVLCAAYGALKLYWALGGGLLLREAPLAGTAQRDLLEHRPNMVVLNSASAALAVIGVALALATLRDGRLPRLLVVGLPALVGGLMLVRALLSAVGDVAVLNGAADGSSYTAAWDLALWSPFFAAWGAAWALAAVAAHRRTAGRAGRRGGERRRVAARRHRGLVAVHRGRDDRDRSPSLPDGPYARGQHAGGEEAGSIPAQQRANGQQRPRKLDVFLLSCGLIAPLIYVAIDIFLAMRWEGYSYRDQTISELNAIGAPTRTLSIVLGITGYAVLVAFGAGVWRSAAGRRSLRVAGGALTLFGVFAWFGVPLLPMHVRGAEQSLTDTLHVAQLAVAGPLILVIIGCGAAVFGRRFRLYSGATVLVMLAFGGWSGTYSDRMINGLDTPWMGVLERISVYSYQLWFAVFALGLIARAFTGRSELQGNRIGAAASPTRYRANNRDDLVEGRSITVAPPSKRARVAAGIVCAVFVPFVLIHLLWAIGITWGLEEMFGEWSDAGMGLTLASLIGAAAGAAVIFVTMSRVGWHKTRLPDRLLHLGNWVAFAWPAIGTLNPSTTWGMRVVTVPLAIAAFVVARSRPQTHAGELARPPVIRTPIAH